MSFAYLSQSLTLGGTYISPFRVRRLHWLPLLMAIIWAWSPLGSQGMLRFISMQRRIITSPVPDSLQYLSPLNIGDSFCGSCQPAARNAMLQAAMMSIDAFKKSSEDQWGNLKMPIPETIGSNADSGGWWQVPRDGGFNYTSLIGIPLIKPQANGNLSFHLQTWYWHLDNPVYAPSGSKGRLLYQTDDSNNTFLMHNFTGRNTLWQVNLQTARDPETLTKFPISLQMSYAYNGSLQNGNTSVTYLTGPSPLFDPSSPRLFAIRLDAVLRKRYVDLNVSCTPSCRVAAIRDIDKPTDFISSGDMLYLQDISIANLPFAIGEQRLGTAERSIFELFMYAPYRNPFETFDLKYFVAIRDTIDFSDVSAREFADRFSQMLNSWWIAQNDFTSATGGFLNVSDLNSGKQRAVRNATVTASEDQQYLACDHNWLAVLFLAEILMIFAAIISVLLTIARVAPDSLDYLSALTRNIGDLVTPYGSYMDADDRLRKMKHLMLKIGDAEELSDVGTIMIGQADALAPLVKGRLYT